MFLIIVLHVVQHCSNISIKRITTVHSGFQFQQESAIRTLFGFFLSLPTHNDTLELLGLPFCINQAHSSHTK